jgi:hypothetical protein
MRGERDLDRELRESLRAPAPPSGACLDEETLVEFYRGRLSEDRAEAVRDHLAVCASCTGLAGEARTFLQALGASEVEELRQRRRRPGLLPLTLAAAVAVAAAAGLFLMRARRSIPAAGAPASAKVSLPSASPRKPWRDLRIPPAAYVAPVASAEDLVFRSGDQEEGVRRPDAFRVAMEPYAAGDFAQAEKKLAGFLEKRAAHPEASFYRALALIQLGREADAERLLDTSVARGAAALREEARWYRALLRLKAGRFGEALSDLEAVIAASRTHRAAAQALSKQVRPHAGP